MQPDRGITRTVDENPESEKYGSQSHEQKSWRAVFQETEHAKYMDLRRANNLAGNPKSERYLRGVARKQATRILELAIHSHNESL